MKTHKMSNHPIHLAWMKMNGRCNNPNYEHYHRYGGRGIRVCDRWKKFENFYEDVHASWKQGLTLDRYPVKDGDYGPTNFRWATVQEQCNNRSTNTFIFFNGMSKTVAEWSRETGIHHRTIVMRIKNGWTAQDALTAQPVRAAVPDIVVVNELLTAGLSDRNIAKRLGVSRYAIIKAIKTISKK
jgi:hypothetical protein